MSNMKKLYEDICFYIDDFYDDDEIALELNIDISFVEKVRKMYKEVN